MQGEMTAKGRFSTKSGAAKGAIRYAAHRENDKGEQQYREIFDKEGNITKDEACQRMDDDKQKYTYTIILNPGEKDSRGIDMQQVTREVMGKLEDKGLCREWVAVEHNDHTEYTHIHIVAKSNAKLTPDDFKEMRQEEYVSYERQAEGLRDSWRDIETEKSQRRSEELGR